MSNRKHRSHNQTGLWLYFAGIIFGTVCVVSLILLVVWKSLYIGGAINLDPFDGHFPPVVLVLLGSLFLGCIIAFFVGRNIVRPFQTISQAFDRLAEGDFAVRVSTKTNLSIVREIAEHFNAMAYDLSHIETLRTDFVANVSHEIKTPIATIEGYATLLQNEDLSRERRAYYTDKILVNSRRLSNLSTNILTLSKLENQETVLNQKEYRLDEQLRKNILLLEDRWTEKDLEFDMDLPSVEFYGNEQLLDIVWFNLLENAVKHSPRGGTIEVGIEQNPGHLRVTVRDHGEGIDEEVQKHIFEKFYQGDSSHTQEGNGLGLALVKRIVDLCEGTVTVNSASGEGAAFAVMLPMEEDEE